METPGTLDPAPSTAQRPAERARTGLFFFAGCALAQAVLSVAPRLFSTFSMASLRAGDGGYSDTPWIQYLDFAFQGLCWLGALGMIFGLWLYAATFARGKAALARSALILFGVHALLYTFSMAVHIAHMAGARLAPDIWNAIWPILFWAGLAAESAALCCLLLAISGRQREHAGPPLLRPIAATATGAILMYGFSLVSSAGIIDQLVWFEHPWIHFSLSSSFSLFYATALFFLALAHAQAVTREPIAASEPPAPAVFPVAVHRGLAAYRTALLWRLAVTVGGMILLVLAQLGRSLGAMKFFLVATSLLSLVCGAFMVAGMARFATAVPVSSRVRGPASIALGVMIAGVLSDLAATALVFGIFSSNYSTIMAAVKTAPWLSLGGQVLSLVGIVALLVAFFRLGRALDMERIGERVTRIGWMLGFTIPLAVLMQILLRFTRIGPVAGLFFTGAVLVLAIITLVLFIGLLNRLILRLQDAPSTVA